MGVEVRQHAPGKDLAAFMQVPYEVYRGDAAWVAPLRYEISERLNPKKNPFFRHADAALFTAYKDGRLAGRISAQIDREHLRRYDDATGFFGFFDTIDCRTVAACLMHEVRKWLKQRGMKRFRGPLSWSINEEMGLLVEGFDSPPMLMMAHSKPYHGPLLEEVGLSKEKDLLAWRYDVQHIPQRALRAWEQVQAMPEVRIRSMRKWKMRDELRLVLQVHDDAWSNNWGYVPFTEREIRKAAADLRLVIEDDLALMAEINGKPAAICIAIPNLNEAARDLDGKLLPFGIFKLLWRLKVRHPESARLAFMGIHSEFRNTKRYGGLSFALYVEIAKRGERLGYRWGELSWTLEDNAPVNLGIRAMGGEVYKKYRIYEGVL